MMDRREALLLVDRLKRRTRDPDVLTLCEYVHGTDVHGTVQGFRRPDVPWTPPAVIPSTSCPVCAAPEVRCSRCSSAAPSGALIKNFYACDLHAAARCRAGSGGGAGL